MRSAPPSASPCSPPSPPRRRRRAAGSRPTGSRPATGTASRSWRWPRPGSRSPPRWRSPPSGQRRVSRWRCTDMAGQRTTEHQRATAEKNVTGILDAVEQLLVQRGQANISAVAAQADVSRVTVYAHFPTWEALLEAAVERAVRQTMTALQDARLDTGPPAQALERMLAAAWRHLARYGAMAQAVAEQLGPDAVARTHHAAHHAIGALLERGQADGSFRADLPATWLITASIALVHACSDGVRAGHIEEHDAVGILTTSVRDLLTGTRPRTALNNS